MANILIAVGIVVSQIVATIITPEMNGVILMVAVVAHSINVVGSRK